MYQYGYDSVCVQVFQAGVETSRVAVSPLQALTLPLAFFERTCMPRFVPSVPDDIARLVAVWLVVPDHAPPLIFVWYSYDTAPVTADHEQVVPVVVIDAQPTPGAAGIR